MTGQNGASSKLGTKGGKQSLSGREEKKTEASVKWDEGAEEVQSWQVDFCLTGQPFKRPPPPPIRNATISFRRKKKVEANLVLKLFSNAGPINDLTFRERPRKLPESLSCFTSITQVKQQQQQQGKLWNMNIFVPWPFSFGPRFVVERCGRRIWKEAAATLVNIFTHKSLGVAMNRISDHWWPRQLSSRQSPIDGQEVLLGP